MCGGKKKKQEAESWAKLRIQMKSVITAERARTGADMFTQCAVLG